jgi:hypothetical protein
MFTWKRTGRTAFFALTLLLLLIFPYGPLFPWSPVKPGYERLVLQRADIHYPKGWPLDPQYRKVDQFLDESEAFHRMKVGKRIDIVACADWASFWRFLPQHRSSRGIGAVTLATGTVIYMSPRLADRGLDVGEFLRHEISHATLHQNQSLMNAYRMSEAQWLSEGIAVAYGKQKAYYSYDEFLTRARRERDVALFLDPARRGEVRGIFEMRYAYAVWRAFNEYLMARDREAYQRYVRSVMEGPRQWRDKFVSAFGMKFEEAVAKFEASL